VQNKSLSLSQKRKKLAEQKNQKKAIKQNVKGISPSQEQLTSLLAPIDITFDLSIDN
jgi:hypothetical protein